MSSFLSRGLVVAVALVLVTASASADPFEVISGDVYTFIAPGGGFGSPVDTGTGTLYEFLHTMNFDPFAGVDLGTTDNLLPSSFPVNVDNRDGPTPLGTPVVGGQEFLTLGVIQAFGADGMTVVPHVVTGGEILDVGVKSDILAGWDGFKGSSLNTQGTVDAASMWGALGLTDPGALQMFVDGSKSFLQDFGSFGIIGSDDIFTHSPPGTGAGNLSVNFGEDGSSVNEIGINFLSNNDPPREPPGGPIPEPISLLLCVVGAGFVLRKKIAA
jgi:hypothetical protein